MPEVVEDRPRVTSLNHILWHLHVRHSLDYKSSLDSTIWLQMLDMVDVFLIILIMLLCKLHVFMFIKEQPICNVL